MGVSEDAVKQRRAGVLRKVIEIVDLLRESLRPDSKEQYIGSANELLAKVKDDLEFQFGLDNVREIPADRFNKNEPLYHTLIRRAIDEEMSDELRDGLRLELTRIKSWSNRTNVGRRDSPFWFANTLGEISKADLDRAYRHGMIKKEDLVDGAYYYGISRPGEFARWDAKENSFMVTCWNMGIKYGESCPHPVDDKGLALFVPLSMTTNVDETYKQE